MQTTTVIYETDGPVAKLTLNRPERTNAMNKTMLEEIEQVCDAVDADPNIRALVVTGTGSAFSSGFDLKEQMQARPRGKAVWREILDRDFNATMRFWSLSKPTIAAVHGPCLAGAFELALACDITIADETAFFGEPELKFGAGIVTMILPWITGPKQAKEIILNGLDNIPAAEAHRLGLVNRVVPAGTDVQAAMVMARHVAVIDPDLVRETKRAINRAYEIQGMREALAVGLDIDHSIESHGSPDKQAFMDIAREKGLRPALDWRDARFDAAKR